MLKAYSSALLTRIISLLQDGGAFEEAFSGHSWDGFGHHCHNPIGRQHGKKHVQTDAERHLRQTAKHNIICLYIYIYIYLKTCIVLLIYKQCAPVCETARSQARQRERVCPHFIWCRIWEVNIVNHPFAVGSWVQWPIFAESQSCLDNCSMECVVVYTEIVSFRP